MAHYIAESNAHYYSHRDPLGQAGDFVTAPEISQMFGEIIGLALVSKWLEIAAPCPIAYAELGPGRGTLARDALRVMARAGLKPEVHFVEASPALREVQTGNVSAATWHQDISSLPEGMPLLIVANEFFDALPVRQLALTERGWREVMLAHDNGSLTAITGNQPMDQAIPAHLKNAPTGTLIETSPASHAVMREMAIRLKRSGGMALIFDYGEETPGFGSSVQAIHNHEKIDIFSRPGEADLTAHVNFGALMETARGAGCSARLFTQGDWLKSNGIVERTRQLANAEPSRRSEQVAALERLASPQQMGDLFKCLVLLPDPRIRAE